ncbi:hypothetical protein MLD38_004357 [Melastoma candidum]|uniref:Uncharacterized protein n=1 Tax=Melastoma candidum TaxID=119954 RepID=A0ACB9S5G8_9MYRT|nr:hypothetical protein MLD38_004357 [Melastoma candidum]
MTDKDANDDAGREELRVPNRQLARRSEIRLGGNRRASLDSQDVCFMIRKFDSSAFKAVFRMASEPQRPHQWASPQSSSKRTRTMMTTASPMRDAFSKYADYLNNLNEKREKVVKASRDITMNSKKVIFQVHRISKFNKEEVLAKAENDLAAVTNQQMAKLVQELKGRDFWKLRRAYSPGVQEYVEAATFYGFCKSGTLLGLDDINASLLSFGDPSDEPLQINILDYLLGLADLTGELMRLAIGRISDGELDFAREICGFVREIHQELMLTVPHMDDTYDMKTKMDTMLQSVMKIENACFSVHVRGSEYIPLLGSGDPSYSVMGVSDDVEP